MDSKLKRIAVLIVSLAVLSVLGIVVLANMDTIRRRSNAVSSVSSVTASDKVKDPSKGKILDAWKSDETFFDNDKESLAARILEEMKSVSLKASSVERDLRIRILDYEGNPLTGEAFSVSVRSSAGEEQVLEDRDSDGLICLTDIEPGVYEVFLLPKEDFNVQEEPVRVTVKSKVELSVIEDISLFMRKEADTDKEKNDLMSLSALDYADKKQKTSFDSSARYGVDISSDNGEVDWVKVYDSGIRFVMLRAGYRGAASGELTADERFSENARNAYRAGLDVGAYFFSQAVNEREAVEEASALCVLCSGLNVNYPLCIRIDRADGNGRADGISEETRTQIAEAFCKTVKTAGYDPFVYASGKWLTTNLDAKRIGKYGVWLSEFKSVPSYEEYYDMWQCSSKGRVPGIEGEVGLNITYIKESE